MAYKKKGTGTNPDDDSYGILSAGYMEDFFTQEENQSYGASELIKAGKTERPDDQLLRTIFDSQAQARACASALARARKYKVTAANEYITFYLEGRVSVKGVGRQQYLQGITGTYDGQAAARLWETGKSQKKNDNTRGIMAGD